MSDWKERYHRDLEDERWHKRSSEIRERDKHTCQDCSQEGGILQVHHECYAKGSYWSPWEYPDATLITLCVSCHKKRHKYNIPSFYPDKIHEFQRKHEERLEERKREAKEAKLEAKKQENIKFYESKKKIHDEYVVNYHKRMMENVLAMHDWQRKIDKLNESDSESVDDYLYKISENLTESFILDPRNGHPSLIELRDDQKSKELEQEMERMFSSNSNPIPKSPPSSEKDESGLVWFIAVIAAIALLILAMYKFNNNSVPVKKDQQQPVKENVQVVKKHTKLYSTASIARDVGKAAGNSKTLLIMYDSNVTDDIEKTYARTFHWTADTGPFPYGADFRDVKLRESENYIWVNILPLQYGEEDYNIELDTEVYLPGKY